MFFINHDEHLNDYTNKVVEEYEAEESEVISYLAFYSYDYCFDLDSSNHVRTKAGNEEIVFNIDDLKFLLEQGSTLEDAISELRNQWASELQLLDNKSSNLRWFIPSDTIPKIAKYINERYGL